MPSVHTQISKIAVPLPAPASTLLSIPLPLESFSPCAHQLHLNEIEIAQSDAKTKINFAYCYFSTLFILRIIKSHLF